MSRMSQLKAVSHSQSIPVPALNTLGSTLTLDVDFYVGCSAVMWATERCKVAEVAELVTSRADLNLRNGGGKTAFELAEDQFGDDIPPALQRLVQTFEQVVQDEVFLI